MCPVWQQFIVQLHCKHNTTNVICACVCLYTHAHAHIYTYIHTYIHSPPGKVFARPYSRCSAGMKYKELLDIFLTTSNTDQRLATLQMQYVELRKILYWLVGVWWFV